MHDLLDMLALQAGTVCLSNLSHGEGRKAVVRALDSIPTGVYSLEQWTEAVRYITKNPALTPQSEREARLLLRL